MAFKELKKEKKNTTQLNCDGENNIVKDYKKKKRGNNKTIVFNNTITTKRTKQKKRKTNMFTNKQNKKVCFK